jgi:CheY-like chemotaxis protein
MSKKILIVDDSAALRQSIGFILVQAGYKASEAVDGLEALLDSGITLLDTAEVYGASE